uniref:EMAP like 1 n=1 Tax=Hucho hucho TaxID=62062 RepID=A0A4W5QTW0_9TELE
MEDGFSSYSSLYDTSSLLQFCNDDSASAASSMEVTDRIASLEQRVQMQEDEIQLLKSALADVVRRLSISEEQNAMTNRRGPTKVLSSILPSLPSTVRRTNSNETMSTLTRKDSGDSKSNRTRAGSTGSNSSGKRAKEGYVKMYLKGRPITMYMAKDLIETYNLEAKSDLPNKKLKLDWVYGYRGRDCRSNLYLLPTGETVYFIASVVVLYNVDEQLQRHYTGHTDDIKCLAVHPDKITIATGQVAGTSSDGKQLAPHVRVWDSVSLNTLHVLGTGFFDRALVCLAFSKSNGGNTLCVVDDSNDHVLSVWDWQREERLADVKCSNEGVFAADFHPTDTNIIVTCGKSHLYFWTLERGTLVKKQGLFEKQEKPKFVLSVTFSENGDTITGDSSGNILVWGKGTNRISHAIQGAHDGSIFALCMLRSGTLVSGGKDRKLISWDGSYQQIQSVEVRSVAVCGVCQSKNQAMRLKGVVRRAQRQDCVEGHSSFITHLDWSVDSQYLVSNSGDYEILYWIPSVCKQVVSVETTRDIPWATSTCTLGFQVFGLWPDGSDGTDINAVSRSNEKQLLVTGDDFGKVCLFSYPCCQFRAPSHVYGGHSSHVTNVNFLFDDSCLVSTGGKDMSVMQWRIV